MDKDTFTRNELREALWRVGLTGREWSAPLGTRSRQHELLNAILDDVISHREPDYFDGSMYEDDNGNAYMFLADSPSNEACWQIPGLSENIRFDIPRRPMHLLIRKDGT